jgi:2-iminobutanoate/2-iminopropanoate deaminase
MTFDVVSSEKVFRSTAPYSLATVTQGSRILHISGQIAQDGNGKTIAVGDVAAQTEKVIDNIAALVGEAGGSLSDICKVMIFLTSRDHLPAVMEIRRRRFKEPFPATSAIIVAGLANPEWMIEIEATAVLP